MEIKINHKTNESIINTLMDEVKELNRQIEAYKDTTIENYEKNLNTIITLENRVSKLTLILKLFLEAKNEK